MRQLKPLCPDCGRPMPSRALCAACEQDRAMEQAQMAAPRTQGQGMRCYD